MIIDRSHIEYALGLHEEATLDLEENDLAWLPTQGRVEVSVHGPAQVTYRRDGEKITARVR